MQWKKNKKNSATVPHLYFISWFISALFILFVSLPDWVKRRVLLDTVWSRALVFSLSFFELISLWRLWCVLDTETTPGLFNGNTFLCFVLFCFYIWLHSGLFIYCNDTSISTWHFPQFTVIQRSLQSVPSLPPQGLGGQKAADLFISFAARDTEIEKTYLLSTRLSLRTELWSAAVSLG